ncbi:low affinity iron permease family protein [Sphingomonas sp. ID1715]|uniref:low affinity iron permease family protein n=1 Tax=Sphingomonas sp. ID1715 TaxID=1656898 RepID=UPI001487BEA6|nr:low affinity iron permease family protein [Sphingomonas sp. ID1715]NNM76446.1 low affinity iron permease family protein [Sphingomonas sp. ID1715]
MDASRFGSDPRKSWLPGAGGFARFATSVAMLAGQPIAFVLALGAILLWLLSGPLFAWSDTWQLVVNTATTIITFLMVFLIQNSQNRDAAAMQAKLDELIRAMRTARNDFIGIEHLTDVEIELIRRDLEQQVAAHEPGRRAADSVRHLLKRR